MSFGSEQNEESRVFFHRAMPHRVPGPWSARTAVQNFQFGLYFHEQRQLLSARPGEGIRWNNEDWNLCYHLRLL